MKNYTPGMDIYVFRIAAQALCSDLLLARHKFKHLRLDRHNERDWDLVFAANESEATSLRDLSAGKLRAATTTVK